MWIRSESWRYSKRSYSKAQVHGRWLILILFLLKGEPADSSPEWGRESVSTTSKDSGSVVVTNYLTCLFGGSGVCMVCSVVWCGKMVRWVLGAGEVVRACCGFRGLEKGGGG